MRGVLPIRLGALVFGLLVLWPLTAACAPATSLAKPATLRVGLIPNQAPETIKAQYQPFQHYLSQALGMPVELFVATDYAGVVEAMASDRVDLAYFGGLTYVQAERRAEVYPIVTEIDRETATTRYYSAIIVRADSPFHRVEDLRGKRFAFGDISSTSGSLYPRILLDRAGITNFTDPAQFVYTGGHDATAQAIVNGTVDAGGIEKRILRRLIDQGTIPADQTRIVEQTLVQGYPWVVRAKLDTALVERIARSFLDLEDPELLKLMRAERYARIGRADYDEVRQEAARLGLLK